MDILKNLLSLKQKPVLQKGDIRISYDENLCYIIRTFENSEMILILNQSGKTVRISQTGTILAQNKLLEGNLLTDGFVVYEN
ncbi:hypothetical protein D3C73_1185960 [compost metagenome]